MRKNKENLHQQGLGDRFIPTEVRSCAFQLQSSPILKDKGSNTYQNLLSENILTSHDMNAPKNNKIMNFGARKQKAMNINNENIIKSTKYETKKRSQKKPRKISKKPFKILQAPNLQDDFYLNLLDWSSDNHISVALESSLYLWSNYSSDIVKLYQTNQTNDYICSVSFCHQNQISIGNSYGQIKVFDYEKKKKINTFQGHTARVGSLNFSNGLLASGSRDGTVGIWDLRAGIVNKYKAHHQQICGLKWNPDGKYIASGGNDNKLVIYSHQKQAEMVKFHEHTAAVKAIGWCHSNPSVLASGGGTADRHIRFFSTNSLKQSYNIDTGSQICNLLFSKISNQMITTHGYSLNQINLWNTDSNWEEKTVNKVQTLTGHTYRVLYLADSPSGQSILTGAGDQTLRFWNVFDSTQYKSRQNLGLQMDLR